MNVRFQVVLLPTLEPLARYCTLREAVAFAQGYHEVIDRGEVEAVIRLEVPFTARGGLPRLSSCSTASDRLRRCGYPKTTAKSALAAHSA